MNKLSHLILAAVLLVAVASRQVHAIMDEDILSLAILEANDTAPEASPENASPDTTVSDNTPTSPDTTPTAPGTTPPPPGSTPIDPSEILSEIAKAIIKRVLDFGEAIKPKIPADKAGPPTEKYFQAQVDGAIKHAPVKTLCKKALIKEILRSVAAGTPPADQLIAAAKNYLKQTPDCAE